MVFEECVNVRPTSFFDTIMEMLGDKGTIRLLANHYTLFAAGMVEGDIKRARTRMGQPSEAAA